MKRRPDPCHVLVGYNVRPGVSKLDLRLCRCRGFWTFDLIEDRDAAAVDELRAVCYFTAFLMGIAGYCCGAVCCVIMKIKLHLLPAPPAVS